MSENMVGKKTTFFDLLDEYDEVVIPNIQRDFAYGRADKGVKQKRKQFLKNIIDSLIQNKKLDLNYIYGSVEAIADSQNENEDSLKFVLIDGQQRLTILFLLQWYISLSFDDCFEEFQNKLRGSSKSKFTYNIRNISRELCNHLVALNSENAEKIRKCIAGNGSLGQVIKNEMPWFFQSWLQDPTVRSMINFLEDLNKEFCGYSKKNGIDDELKNNIDRINDLFEFHKLEIQKFNRPEDVYIKMNARGKPLTDFENFKAKFQQKLEKADDLDVFEEFSRPMDNEWLDLFWNFATQQNENQEVDNYLMNFIRSVIIIHFALHKSKSDENKENFKKLNSDDHINYYQLDAFGCFDDIVDLFRRLKFSFNLFTGADEFENIKKSETEEGIALYMGGREIFDEKEIFTLAAKNEMTYTQKVQFYAFTEYLFRTKDDCEEWDRKQLEDWMRVIRNLTVNTTIDNPEIFHRSIYSVRDNLLGNSDDINSFIAEYEYDPEKSFAFNKSQTKEESLKANLILRKNDGEQWEKEIKDIENHVYFQGQIDFLLDFCDVRDKYNSEGVGIRNVDISKEFERFKKYKRKVQAIIRENTKKSEAPGIPTFEENYWFERAMLTVDFYLPKHKGKRYCFCENASSTAVEWKELLTHCRREDDEYARGYKAFKNLLDDLSLFSNQSKDRDEITEQLKEKVQTSINNGDYLADWWGYFVEFPEAIDACRRSGSHSYKIIRKKHISDILLLETKTLRGKHREYYSFILYLKIKNKLGSSKVNYYWGSTDQGRKKEDGSVTNRFKKRFFINKNNEVKWELWWGDDKAYHGKKISPENPNKRQKSLEIDDFNSSDLSYLRMHAKAHEKIINEWLVEDFPELQNSTPN